MKEHLVCYKMTPESSLNSLWGWGVMIFKIFFWNSQQYNYILDEFESESQNKS